jgi:hypothetical protein
VRAFPKEVDVFFERASESGKLMAVRDHKYLTWRYCQCPTRAYTIDIAEINGKFAGYLVRRSFEKDGLRLGALMDVLVEPGREDVLHALLASAIEAFRREKLVDALIALMQPDELYYPALRRQGFLEVPERFNPRSFNFVCRVLSSELPEADFYASRNWHLTLGDYDVY